MTVRFTDSCSEFSPGESVKRHWSPGFFLKISLIPGDLGSHYFNQWKSHWFRFRVWVVILLGFVQQVYRYDFFKEKKVIIKLESYQTIRAINVYLPLLSRIFRSYFTFLPPSCKETWVRVPGFHFATDNPTSFLQRTLVVRLSGQNTNAKSSFVFGMLL